MKIDEVTKKFRDALLSECEDLDCIELSPGMDQWFVIIDDVLDEHELIAVIELLREANKTPPNVCDDE